MGAVYAGIDRSTRTRVAVKVIQASSSHQLDALHRFLLEARTAATINHPAVVRVVHVDVSDDGLLYQVQELVDGDTLQKRLRLGKRWEPSTVARFVSVLCEALAAAHAQGIVHRDVKPSNVMLTKTAPGLRLLDFGIAKLYEDVSGQNEATQAGVILGTPAFMAPEQIDGRNVTDRADVYAVGVIVFLLLTGRYPFDEGTPRAMIMSHVLVPAPDARTLEPTVPEDLAALVARCLAKDPIARPSAAELAKTLATFADARGAQTLDAMEQGSALCDVEVPAAEAARTAVARKRPVA